MARLFLEKDIDYGNGRKLVFSSFLRRDFVDQSVVIRLDGAGRVEHVYFSSYRHGSVEWINGSGLSECRFWETEDQAREPTYLTRRYTSRLSDGEADTGYAAQTIIPDVLDNMADGEVASILKKIIAGKRSDIDAGFSTISFRKRTREEERSVDEARASIIPDVPGDRGGTERPDSAPDGNLSRGSGAGATGSAGMIRDILEKILPRLKPREPGNRAGEQGDAGINAGHDRSVRDRAEEGRRTARRVAGKKKR